MIRAVLDSGVLIAGLISPAGAPAALLDACRDGRFDAVVCPMLLAEVRRALAYPKLEKRVAAADADAFIAWLARAGVAFADPASIPPVTRDPNDDFLFALALEARASIVVSGDADVLDVPEPPVRVATPRTFLDLLAD